MNQNVANRMGIGLKRGEDYHLPGEISPTP